MTYNVIYILFRINLFKDTNVYINTV